MTTEGKTNYNLGMKKVQILSLHLGFGGIEKAVCSLANMLVDRYDVEIISVYKLLAEPAFYLDGRVKVTYLTEGLKPNEAEFRAALKKANLTKVLSEGFKSAKILFYKKYRTIRAIRNSDADVMISSRYFFNDLIGRYARAGVKKIGWEHNHWEVVKGQHDEVVKSADNLDWLVSCSKQINEHYSKYVKCKTTSIGNVIDDVPDAYSNLNNRNCIAVGSLIERKGFLDLVEIFNEVCKKDDSWHLDLFGDGEQKQQIIDKISNYGLEKNITVHGFQKKEVINQYLHNASVYTMTSRSEALPIVLLEAVSFGLPCLAFECPGTDEVIDEGENGYIIPGRDINRYSEALLKVMHDDELRHRLGAHSVDVSKRYGFEVIRQQWIDVIEN